MKFSKKIIFFFGFISLFCFFSNKAFSQDIQGRDYFRGVPVTSLDINGPFNVIVKESEDSHIKFFVKDNLLADIQVEYKSGTAILTYKGVGKKIDPKDLTIHIHTPKIENIKLSNACILSFEGSIAADKINFSLKSKSQIVDMMLVARIANFNIAEASSVKAQTINTRSLSINLEASSTFEANAPQSKNINIKLTSASTLKLSGSCKSLDIVGKTASISDCNEMIAESVNVSLSEASESTVYALESISIYLKGASLLKYKGFPQVKTQKILDISKAERINL